VASATGRATRAAKLLGVYAVAAALGLVAAKVGGHLFPVLPSERMSLTHDPVEKARWFLTGPLVDALNPGALAHSRRRDRHGDVPDRRPSSTSSATPSAAGRGFPCCCAVCSCCRSAPTRSASWTAFRRDRAGRRRGAARLAARGLATAIACVRRSPAVPWARFSQRTTRYEPTWSGPRRRNCGGFSCGARRRHCRDETDLDRARRLDWSPALYYDEFGLVVRDQALAPAVAIAFRERGPALRSAARARRRAATARPEQPERCSSMRTLTRFDILHGIIAAATNGYVASTASRRRRAQENRSKHRRLSPAVDSSPKCYGGAVLCPLRIVAARPGRW
jgi:hypothetical protein